MNKKLQNEISSFLSEAADHKMPAIKEKEFLTRMKKRIEPNLGDVLPKFLLAQLGAALATLSICPQFGIGPIGGGHGIGHFFMSFGEPVCAAFCGAFFLATGTIVAMILLRHGERRSIFNYRYRVISAISVASFLLFMGAQKSLNLTGLYDGVVANLMWPIGAMLSSLAVVSVARFSTSFAKQQK